MPAAPVRLDLDGRIAHLRLDRPDRRNALNEAMWRAIPGLVAEAENTDGVRCLVVRGEGGAFAAGADIAEFETVYATPERAAAYAEAISAALEAIAGFSRPSLAVIEGACVGGGCAIALACDLRFAAENARFGVTPARLGLAYPFEDTRRLVEAVGVSAAKDLLFTGRLIGAGAALEMGLVDRVCAPERLDELSDAWLAALLGASAWSARAAKQMIARIEAGQTGDCAETRALFLEGFSGPDFAEGARAFMDKRAPDFT